MRKNGELVLTADWGILALNPDSSLAWKIDSRDLGSGRWYGHHEVVELPNGNMLLPGFIEKTRSEAANKGFPVTAADQCPNTPKLNDQNVLLRVDNIWELAPKDKKVGFKNGWQVVWRWNLWDHISQGPTRNKADISYIDPAEGICGQYIQGAWTFGRFNALGFNPQRNEIVMSESLQNEIRIINHNITTEDVKDDLGGFIYRWGNPYAYGAGAPFVSPSNRGDQKLSFQHRVQWIPQGYLGAGNILIFNNGTDWGDSSVIEIRTPIDRDGNYRQPRLSNQAFGPAAPVWQYSETPSGTFFASAISSAQRLRNGNTLINNGMTGYFFEVTPQGKKVWEYKNPANGAPQGGSAAEVYRIWRYSPDFAGLARMRLTPSDPLETYKYVYPVDIKPGSYENPVNRKSRGVLPVAIAGSRDLDVSTINPNTILLEGFPAAKWSIEDVTTPKAWGRDGYPDLVLKWDSSFVNTALRNQLPGKRSLMRLTGYSSQGWFKGKDKVLVTE